MLFSSHRGTFNRHILFFFPPPLVVSHLTDRCVDSATDCSSSPRRLHLKFCSSLRSLQRSSKPPWHLLEVGSGQMLPLIQTQKKRENGRESARFHWPCQGQHSSTDRCLVGLLFHSLCETPGRGGGLCGSGRGAKERELGRM